MSSLSYIFLILFFFFFAYLAKRDPRKGLYLIIFLMPAYLVRFSAGGIPTTALEILIYILFLSCLLFWRQRKDAFKEQLAALRQEQVLYRGLLLLFAGVTLSTLFSADVRTSLGAWKGWFVDPLLFFLMYISLIRGPREISKSLLAFVLSGFAVALSALLYASFGLFTFDGRLRASYESPNYLAMYLAPALLFALLLFGFGQHAQKNDRKIQTLVLLILTAALLWTQSYGALLGIAAALTSLFWKRFWKKDAPSVALNKKALTVLFALALMIFSFLTLQKYEQLASAGARSSLASRFMIWDAAREMLGDSPLVGIGPGTFQKTYLTYQNRFPIPYLEWAVPQPHNTFLAFYLQAGLIGFLGFLFLLVWLGRRARSEEIVFLFLSYFTVHSLVDTLYWKNDLALMFFLVLGIAFVAKKNSLVR